MPEQQSMTPNVTDRTHVRRWSSTEATARIIGMHPQTLRKLATAGHVPAIRYGGRFAFNIDDVVKALAI